MVSSSRPMTMHRLPAKEVIDYIKVQRSLGVTDVSIKKSLLDAGYAPEDVAESVRRAGNRKSSRSFPRLTLSSQTLLVINVVIALIIIGLVVFFAKVQNDRIDQIAAAQESAAQDMNQSVATQYEALGSQMSAAVESLRSEISATRTVMETSDSEIKETIEENNYEALRRDSVLSGLYQDLSHKSSEDLVAMQEEFSEFKDSTVDFSKIIPKATAAVVLVGEQEGPVFNMVGSGVFINNAGYIVTNEHVIDDLGKITVRTDSSVSYFAAVVGADEELDVALLSLDTDKNDFPYLGWADSDDVYVGQPVIAIGNPLGFESTVTQGIISNTKRQVEGVLYFQTDVAINKGNSGGPLIDKNGKIVGIATRKYMETGYEGLSFALRSNDVKDSVLVMLQNE